MNSSFPNRWSFSYLKFTKYVTNITAEPKYKYGQQEQVTKLSCLQNYPAYKITFPSHISEDIVNLYENKPSVIKSLVEFLNQIQSKRIPFLKFHHEASGNHQ